MFGLTFASLSFLAPGPVHATSPGYNGKLLITQSHVLYNGQTRSNIAANMDGSGFIDYTAQYGFANTQKLYYTADGTGFVGVKGYADLLAQVFHSWPSLPMSLEFDFTACGDNRFYFRTTGPKADGWYIYSMKFDGSDQREVSAVDARGLSCSPDGTKIAFAMSPPDTGIYSGDLYTIDTDGTDLTRLTTGQSLHVDGDAPSWSPDGRTIAYSINAGSPADPNLIGIWTVDVVTHQAQRIFIPPLNGGNNVSRPVYSPDGTTIAFYDVDNGSGCWATHYGECLMNADGTNVRAFPAIANDTFPTNTTSYAFVSSWQPVTNKLPVTAADSLALAANTTASADVLANDTDEQALDPKYLTIKTAPSHGTTTVTSGKVSYTPASNYTGSDQLTYQICDSFLLDQKCATGVLGITVTAAPITPTPTPASLPAMPATPTISSIGTVQMHGATTVYYTGHRPTFSGTATPGATITVTIHSDPIVLTTTADSLGTWSVTPSRDIPDGDHQVMITAAKDGTTSPTLTLSLGINTGLAATGTPIWPLSVVGLVWLIGTRELLRLRCQ